MPLPCVHLCCAPVLWFVVGMPHVLRVVCVVVCHVWQGTWFDNTGLVRADVGAGQGNSPYRFRPLMWAFNQSSYLNERTVGVQVLANQSIKLLIDGLPSLPRCGFCVRP